MAAAHVPGLALAVIQSGEVSYVHAYGERDTGRHLPLQTDTVMYAASLTKAAFAYAVMMLVDKGRLDLDTTISRVLERPLPEYRGYTDLAGDARWARLTPRILLSHQGGFANYRYGPPGKDYDPAGKLRIYFDPGTRYSYSGEGINLLQLVIEKGRGIEVGDYLRTALFDRFGMSRTSLLWRDEFAANYAEGYDESGRRVPHTRQAAVRAASSMDTTIHDYAQLLAAMVRGEGLSPKTYIAWLTPQTRIRSRQQFPIMVLPDSADNDGIALGYALGVGVFRSPQGPAWFKEGHDDGTGNLALCLRESRRCLLLMSNSSNAESIFPYLISAVLGETCFPWYWDGYIPYDQPQWRSPAAAAQAHPPCLHFHS